LVEGFQANVIQLYSWEQQQQQPTPRIPNNGPQEDIDSAHH
jgi:hypothetical protein